MRTFEMDGETYRIIATSKNLIDIEASKSICGGYGQIGISRNGVYVWYESLSDHARRTKDPIRIWDQLGSEDRKEA